MSASVDCAAALLPQLDIQNRTRAAQNAWLNLISESTYESFRTSAGANSGASAGLPVDGIPAQFSGFFNGAWDDFREKRRDYLSLEEGDHSEAATEALFRQSLTDAQLEKWLACMLKDQVGVFVLLSDDTAESVTATIRYIGVPASTLSISVSIANGKADGQAQINLELAHGASHVLNIIRKAPDADIKVVANSISFAAVAVSVWPPPAVVPRITFGAINANQFSDGTNVTDDRLTSQDRLFVRAIDASVRTRLYVPLPAAPSGISKANLMMNFSSAMDTAIRVAVVSDEMTAKTISPSSKVNLRGVGAAAGWANRQNAALGEFSVKEGVNYVVVETDSGRQWPLINGFWFDAQLAQV